MEQKLKNVCETYIFNRDEMRRILRSSGAPMHLMGAAVLTALGKKPDEKRILEAERMLQEKEPEESPIRGWIKSVTTAHMMLSEDMEVYYKELKRTHDLIYVNRGGDDERYYIAAMMMSHKISNMQEILMLVERASLIHERMGKSFTSQEDKSFYVTAVFAAVNGILDVRAYIDKVHECKRLLEEAEVFGEEVPENMCMLLAIPPVPAEVNCAKAVEIIKAIRSKGIEFDSEEEAAMLSFLAVFDKKPEDVAEAVHDADEFLKVHSGFLEGEGIILRRVYASMLVTMAYAPFGVGGEFGTKIAANPEIIKRWVLMQSQSVMHIQMAYVNIEDLHI